MKREKRPWAFFPPLVRWEVRWDRTFIRSDARLVVPLNPSPEAHIKGLILTSCPYCTVLTACPYYGTLLETYTKVLACKKPLYSGFGPNHLSFNEDFLSRKSLRLLSSSEVLPQSELKTPATDRRGPLASSATAGDDRRLHEWI